MGLAEDDSERRFELMNKAGWLLVGTLLSVGTLAASSAGCGGGGNGGEGGSGGSGGNPASTGTGASTSTGTGDTSTSTTGTGGAPPATCDGYCTTIMANCTAATQQYADKAQCMAVCATFPAGMPGDMSGGSLECRAYHADAAAGAADTHCHHAGISGGDQNPQDEMAAACGDGCDAYCDLLLTTCTGPNDVLGWAGDKPACIADCRLLPMSAAANTYDVADTFEESFNCHLYHAVATLDDPDTHCAHAINPGLFCHNP
jgi:hypothetical protein